MSSKTRAHTHNTKMTGSRAPRTSGYHQSRRLSLQENFSWVLGGSVAVAAGNWIILIILAKLGTLQMVGRYALGLAITAPIVMLVNMDLRSILVTDVQEQYSFQDYLGFRVLTTLLALAILLSILLLTNYPRETKFVVLLVGIANLITSVTDIIFALLQSQERMDRIAKSNIMRTGLSLGLFTVFVALTHDIVLGVLGVSIAALCVLLGFDTRSVLLASGLQHGSRAMCLQAIRPRFTWQSIRGLFLISWPLGVVMCLVTLNVNIPRYFTERSQGEEALAIFSAMASLTTIGGTITASLLEAAFPKLAKHYAAGNAHAYLSLQLKLIALATSIALGGLFVAVIAGKPLLTIIYTREYAQHLTAFHWLMGSAIPLYIAYCFGNGMTASRSLLAQIPLFAIVTACAVASCAIFIPRMGLNGAAIAVFLTSVVQAVGGAIIVIFAVRRLHRCQKGDAVARTAC